MDDRKEYAPFSIPRRGTQSEETPGPDRTGSSIPNAKTPGVNNTFVPNSPFSSLNSKLPSPDTHPSSLNSPLSKDSPLFAEIEYEPNIDITSASAQALRFYSSNRDMSDRSAATRDIAAAGSALRGAGFTPPQPIAQREVDPIREKFYKMRRLVSDRPFARNDSELFYRQAKFMEDFTDDYEGGAKFFMYYPCYQNMGYEQLRTYFTWRVKARRGEIVPTSMSYAFLYVYELLSGIGTEDPADGLNKLVAIWDGFLKYGPALENYLPKWLKDYHIFYELPHTFTDFIKEHSMQKYYSLMLMFDTETENEFDIWNSISTYDVTRSKFYNEGNEQLFKDCFSMVLKRIHEYCESRGKSFEELFIYKISNRIVWNPFSQALFYSGRRRPDRQINMPGRERYYCKNDKWTAKLPIYYSNHKDYAGFILKKTESCLRQVLNYKYKLTAELKDRTGYYKEFAVTATEIDVVIEKAVADFHRDKNRTIVTIDHINLARIRKEALGTQDKLIVPEEDDSGVASANSETITALAQCAPYNPPLSSANPQHPIQTLVPDVWMGLKNALGAMELEALSLALRGGSNIKSFADENGIMLEVLVDGINDKAMDCIGDSIIEMDDDIKIYDEYRENIAGLL